MGTSKFSIYYKIDVNSFISSIIIRAKCAFVCVCGEKESSGVGWCAQINFLTEQVSNLVLFLRSIQGFHLQQNLALIKFRASPWAW